VSVASAVASHEDWSVPAGDCAVLINANAGRVRREIARRLARAAPQVPVFWTKSLDEADDALEAVIESGAKALFAGGGDGTILDMATRLLRYRHAPALGILRLGTGNALATWARARGIEEDVAAWVSGEAYRALRMRIADADGEPSIFAGMGWDAAVLNDYRWMKQRLQKTPLGKQSHSLAVYLASAFGRTVPRYAARERTPQVTVEVLAGDAFRVDIRGNPAGPRVRPGGVVYRGPGNVTAWGTAPYYGYGFRMFPHAEAEPERMQLRVSALGIPETLNELPRLWAGELESERLHDFLVQDVRISYDEDVPYQVCGDARGMKRSVDLRLSSRSLPVVGWR
jgi:diacylglycerol kinase family enzyme